MAYCTVADAQVYLIHFTIDSTSQPTTAQVESMCDDVSDNIIDPIIRNYVTLPLTDPVGLNYLKQGAIYYVLANTYKGIQAYPELIAEYEDRFAIFLSKIKTNNSVLLSPNDGMPKTASSTRRDPVYTTDPDEECW